MLPCPKNHEVERVDASGASFSRELEGIVRSSLFVSLSRMFFLIPNCPSVAAWHSDVLDRNDEGSGLSWRFLDCEAVDVGNGSEQWSGIIPPKSV
jgi:hypothetical protein